MVTSMGLANQLPDDGQFRSWAIGDEELGDFSTNDARSGYIRIVSEGMVDGRTHQEFGQGYL